MILIINLGMTSDEYSDPRSKRPCFTVQQFPTQIPIMLIFPLCHYREWSLSQKQFIRFLTFRVSSYCIFWIKILQNPLQSFMALRPFFFSAKMRRPTWSGLYLQLQFHTMLGCNFCWRSCIDQVEYSLIGFHVQTERYIQRDELWLKSKIFK